MSQQEIISASIEVPYDDLFRYNEKYVGKIVHLKGQALQVSGSGKNGYVIRLGTKNSGFGLYYDDIVWVEIDDVKERILDDDMLEVYGEVTGIQTYTALLGNEVSLPAVTARVYSAIDEEDVATNSNPIAPKIKDSDALTFQDRYKFKTAPEENTISVKVGPVKQLSGYSTEEGSKVTEHLPQRGNEFLCVLVEINHLGYGGKGYSWFHTPGSGAFTLILDGNMYYPEQPEAYMKGVGSVYSSATLDRKEKTTGYLVYEVPASSDPASGYLQANLGGDNTPVWKLG
jgi:hypothetical protein